MRILGLGLGDTSTAALMVHNRLAAAASEERFSRRKRDESFPEQATAFCLQAAGLRGSDLDAVVLSSGWDFWRWLTHYHSRFTIDDLVREQEAYWRPVVYEGEKLSWPRLFRDRWDLEQFPGGWGQTAEALSDRLELSEAGRKKAERRLDDAIAERLGIAAEKILRVDPHTAYAAYAYWASPFRDKGAAVLVLDAEAGGLGASVSLPGRFGLLRVRSCPASEFLLGRIMRSVTLMLGLPPRDHDPVFLGLAARAPRAARRKVRDVFRRHLALRGMEVVPRVPLREPYFHFLEQFAGVGDEAIAGGLQDFAEELCSGWVRNILKSTGTRRLAVAGSLSMNHRIMARLAELAAVEDIFIPPGAGEGALALGACYQVATSRFGIVPEPLRDACLGPDAGAAEVNGAVEALRASGRSYDVVQAPRPALLADLLASGAIIARCVGRAEFGSRGLGNRSILCDPRSDGILPLVGAKIKGRDSSAAFSPTLIAGEAGRYLVNPKKLASPFMNLSFQATSRGRRELAATVNTDGSLRPHLVEDADNLPFASILRAFQAKTGVPALLNTSLNLRGEPMALTPADAARVFERTSLDYLLVGDILIGKRGATLRRRGARPGPAARVRR